MHAVADQEETVKVFLPYRGEFGHKIMWHVPWVHGQPGRKVVYCEPGEECLFPSAAEHLIVERKRDDLRREWSKYDRTFLRKLRPEVNARREVLEPLPKHPRSNAMLQWFIPEPVQTSGIECDVVVCPRMRRYGHQKNWRNWAELVQRLEARCRVFAAGAPDSSQDVPCERAWDYERFLDATIEAMRSAQLVIATDSGLAHLAVLCGRPLLLISHGKGCTAPGYKRIQLGRYAQANHTSSAIRVLPDTWDDVEQVAAQCGQRLRPWENRRFWIEHYRQYPDARAVCGSAATPEGVRKLTEKIARQFDLLLPKQANNLLDYGCGIGRLAPCLQQRCAHYYGADLMPEAIERAREVGGGTFAVVENGTLPFSGVQFDTIVTVTVLQHVMDDRLLDSLLQQFAERMQRGGTLLLRENIALRKDSHYLRFRRAVDYVARINRSGFSVSGVFVAGQEFAAAEADKADRIARDPEVEHHAFIKAVRR